MVNDTHGKKWFGIGSFINAVAGVVNRSTNLISTAFNGKSVFDMTRPKCCCREFRPLASDYLDAKEKQFTEDNEAAAAASADPTAAAGKHAVDTSTVAKQEQTVAFFGKDFKYARLAAKHLCKEVAKAAPGASAGTALAWLGFATSEILIKQYMKAKTSRKTSQA